MVNGNGVGSGLDTRPLKDKTTAKTEEKPQIGGSGDARLCVLGSMNVHHAPRPTRGGSYPVCSLVFLNAAFWCMCGPRALPWIICIWAYWASFC